MKSTVIGSLSEVEITEKQRTQMDSPYLIGTGGPNGRNPQPSFPHAEGLARSSCGFRLARGKNSSILESVKKSWSSRPDRDSKASVRSRNALLSSTRCRTWLVTTPDFLTLSITWRLSFRPVGAPGHLPFSSFSCFANALLQESDVMF